MSPQYLTETRRRMIRETEEVLNDDLKALTGTKKQYLRQNEQHGFAPQQRFTEKAA